ncbi:ABC transporter substrate-binding protein [Thermoleophilia bacterium SCSIO 60948]|nr:ABC transporter substrate-binding protein [Thermoleophilia bacterium SCSIO 60948]
MKTSPTPARRRRLSLGAALAPLVAALLALLVLPAGASAHPSLVQSSPAAGAISPRDAEEIQLAFTEPVVLGSSEVTVETLDGAPVPTGPLEAAGDERTITIDPAEPLTEGTYELTWTVLGADGHQVGGTLPFGIAAPNGDPPDGAEQVAATSARGGREAEQVVAEATITVIARWASLVAASLLAGGWLLLAVLRRRGVSGVEAAARRWRRVANLAWLVMVAGLFEQTIASSMAGIESGAQLGALVESPAGRATLAQLVLAVALWGVAALARRSANRRDMLVALSGAVVLAGTALAGHIQSLGEGLALAAAAQVVHVLAAGAWLGALVALAVVSRRGNRPGVPFAEALRRFAPVVAVSVVLLVATGVLAALREVDQLYFLRWSAYGQVVLIKSALVVVAIAIGLLAMRRARRGDGFSPIVRWEAGVVVTVLGLAALLASLVPGRGQPLPAEDGTLVPGPALATTIGPDGPLRVTLAPALEGSNRLLVAGGDVPKRGDGPRHVEARLFCGCADEPIAAELEHDPAGGWSTDVELPAEGPWFARLRMGDEKTNPVGLPVGVPEAPGPGPLTVLSVADLSGADAERCRSHVLGLQLAVGRINAVGGLEGGRKLTVLALDDSGSSDRAAELADDAIADNEVVAVAAPCGAASAAAVDAADAAGVPSLVADPAVAASDSSRVFRLAGDPYAEGYAQGQYLAESVAPISEARRVRALDPGDATAASRLAGLEDGLEGSLRVERVDPGAIEDPERARELLDPAASAALLVDGDPGRIAQSLSDAAGTERYLQAAPVLASSRIFSERFVADAGTLGRLGAIQGAVEVTPSAGDALSYAEATPALFPGEAPTLDGLRGYLAGVALDESTDDGVEPEQIEAALDRPAPFADALLSPWRSDAPGAGSQRFSVLKGTFLPPTLIPASRGGDTYNGSFFTDGTWTTVSAESLGPPLEDAAPSLAQNGEPEPSG